MFLGVVLLAAVLFSRSCGSADRQISQERAVVIARRHTPFTAEKMQIRFLQQGIPPRAMWAVSLYDVDAAGRPTRTNVVLVDAKTGAIVPP